MSTKHSFFWNNKTILRTDFSFTGTGVAITTAPPSGAKNYVVALSVFNNSTRGSQTSDQEFGIKESPSLNHVYGAGDSGCYLHSRGQKFVLPFVAGFPWFVSSVDNTLLMTCHFGPGKAIGGSCWYYQE